MKVSMRTTALLLTGILMLLIFLGTFNIKHANCDSSASYWWSMFRHDSTHSGYSPSTAPTTNQTLWNFTTGDWVFSSPAVADGVVYVGSFDNKTYALNATNGDPIWNFPAGKWTDSSPAIVDGVVYVGALFVDLYALNATNGDELWNFTAGFNVGSSPAVADGVVYVGSEDGNVYAFATLVGGKLNKTNYLTSFLTPTLVMVGISGAFVLLALLHIKCSKAYTRKST
jgi:hypothetical protein